MIRGSRGTAVAWLACVGSRRAGDQSIVFPAHNKTEEACASSVVVNIRTPLRVDCRSALAFLTSSGSAFVLPFGCQSRALPPAFLSRRRSVYLKGPRIPIESPSWYDRFSWQNPVRVTHSVPPECWPFPKPYCGPAGRPSAVSLSVRFRPRGLLLPSGDPDLSVGGFHLTGDSRYSWREFMSKPNQAHLRDQIHLPLHQEKTSA